MSLIIPFTFLFTFLKETPTVVFIISYAWFDGLTNRIIKPNRTSPPTL